MRMLRCSIRTSGWSGCEPVHPTPCGRYTKAFRLPSLDGDLKWPCAGHRRYGMDFKVSLAHREAPQRDRENWRFSGCAHRRNWQAVETRFTGEKVIQRISNSNSNFDLGVPRQEKTLRGGLLVTERGGAKSLILLSFLRLSSAERGGGSRRDRMPRR